MTIIIGSVFILMWGAVGGFDWVIDTRECMEYIELCNVCDFFIKDNVDYASLERWQFSMVNKYHEYLYPLDIYKLNPDYYLSFVEMMQEYTKFDHKGMYDILYSGRYNSECVSTFKFK